MSQQAGTSALSPSKGYQTLDYDLILKPSPSTSQASSVWNIEQRATGSGEAAGPATDDQQQLSAGQPQLSTGQQRHLKLLELRRKNRLVKQEKSVDNCACVSCLSWLKAVGEGLRDEYENLTHPRAGPEAHATHLQSFLIPPTRCFLVGVEQLASRAQEAPGLPDRLGVWITYEGPCADGACRKCGNKRVGCAVCPHMFSCSCRLRYRDTEWCAHLHLADRLRLARYGGAKGLFVHGFDADPTEMRHIRAWVQGKHFMEPGPRDECVFEVVESNDSALFCCAERHKVTYPIGAIKEQQIHCDNCLSGEACTVCGACMCFYDCSCEDYWLTKQLCQHCHWVAMSKHKHSKYLFSAQGLPKSSEDCVAVTTLANWNELTERLFASELEHEMSYNVASTGWKQISADKWEIDYPTGQGPFTVTMLHHSRQCICEKPGSLQQFGRRCNRCKICIYDYKCSCKERPDWICCHVHFVARHVKAINEPRQIRGAYLWDKVLLKYHEKIEADFTALGPQLSPALLPEMAEKVQRLDDPNLFK